MRIPGIYITFCLSGHKGNFILYLAFGKIFRTPRHRLCCFLYLLYCNRKTITLTTNVVVIMSACSLVVKHGGHARAKNIPVPAFSIFLTVESKDWVPVNWYRTRFGIVSFAEPLDVVIRLIFNLAGFLDSAENKLHFDTKHGRRCTLNTLRKVSSTAKLQLAIFSFM